MAGESIPVGPWVELGVPLLIDEPSVKCWLEVVPPGESRPAHTHRHPWVTVVLSGAEAESHAPTGEVISRGEIVTGSVRYNNTLPHSHYVVNTSDRTLMMIAIELRHPVAP
ncbi:hypothetical protein [Actinoplanes sp. N902-109]|uniref:hypothetical protein n=1 Tax=Actinoplanes sp. (strain N902-109) TaxID=649831 RepID=UPI00032956D7|nr:hypothetical protein [Actinoplanes sp. N902-109]AGL13737.1 hypothetical protein L083_0227 [Actinoplanes sp. N902-109]